METYYLAYLGPNQSARKRLTLPEDHEFRIEIVDTWEMEISTVGGTYTGKFDIDLPGKPFTALRITRKEEA